MLYYQSISQSNRIPFNITTGKAGDYHKTPVYGTDNTMVEPQIMVASFPANGWRYVIGVFSVLLGMTGVVFNVGALVVIFKIGGHVNTAMVIALVLVADIIATVVSVPVWASGDFTGLVFDMQVCHANEMVESLVMVLTQLLLGWLVIERISVIRSVPNKLRKVSRRIIVTGLVVIFIAVGFTVLIVLSITPKEDRQCGLAVGVTSSTYSDYFPFHAFFTTASFVMSIALWLVMRTRGMFALCSMSGMMFKCRYELHRSWGLFQLVMATNCMAVLVLISELVVVTGYGHQGDYGDLMTRISLQINSLSKPVILVVFNEQFRRKLRRLIRRPHIAPAPTIPSIELPDDLAMGQTEVSRVKVPRSATTQRRITLTVQQDITPSDQQTRRSSKISLQIAGNQSNSGGMILTVNQGNLRRKSAGDIDCLRTDTEEDCSRRVSVTFYDDHSRRLSMDAGIRRYSTHEVTGNIVCENEVDLDLTSVGNKKTEDMDSPFFEAAGDVNGEEKGATEVQEKSTTIGSEQAEEPTETNSSGIQVQVQFNDDQVVTEDLPLGIRKSRSQRRSFAGRRNSTYSDLSSMLGHRNSLSSICTQAYPNSYPLADWTTRRRSQNSISQLPQLRSRAWTSKRGGDCYGLPGAVETPPVTRRGSALACQMRSTCLSSASSSSPSTTSSFGIPLYRRPSQRYTQNPGFHQVRESEESLVEESNMSTMTNWGALNSRSDTGSLRVHRRGRLSLSSLSVGSMSSNDAEYDVIDEPSGVYLGVCGTKKMKKLAASCSSI